LPQGRDLIFPAARHCHRLAQGLPPSQKSASLDVNKVIESMVSAGADK
jgi:hypothetical protein